MSYMQGPCYVWRDDERVHVWADDGYNGWDGTSLLRRVRFWKRTAPPVTHHRRSIGRQAVPFPYIVRVRTWK